MSVLPPILTVTADIQNRQLSAISRQSVLQHFLTLDVNRATDPGRSMETSAQELNPLVRTYQTQQNIGVDGIVGDRTWWTSVGAAGATLASIAGLVTA
jgi:hypothetical protein